MSGRAWVRIAGVEILPEDVLLEAKAGNGFETLRSVALRKVLAREAASRGIAVSEEAVDEALAEFYAEADLFEEDPIRRFLEARRLEPAALRGLVRERFLAARLREEIASDAAVEERFRRNRPDYAEASVEVASFASEGRGRETVLAVREGETPWPGGEARAVTRAGAPEEIAAALFASQPGEMLGPFETEDDDREGWEVWRLVARREPRLDEATREKIREEIFEEFKEGILARRSVEFLS